MFSTSNQADLVVLLRQTLNKSLQDNFTEESELLDKFMGQVDFNKLLLMNAQRKSYGVTPKEYDLYSDETEVCLWTWELTSPSLYLE